MSTITISLPRPFIFTKGRLASALMVPGLPLGLVYMGNREVLARGARTRGSSAFSTMLPAPRRASFA
jgi:hypothetical protein